MQGLSLFLQNNQSTTKFPLDNQSASLFPQVNQMAVTIFKN